MIKPSLKATGALEKPPTAKWQEVDFTEGITTTFL